MDEYSKTAPKSYQAEARSKEERRKRALARALADPTEAGFIKKLSEEPLEMMPDHSRFHQALTLWRSRHLERRV